MARSASRLAGRAGLGALCALAGLAAACGPDAPGGPPNLLLVSLDTLRADHLGLYGYPRETSPFLDRLGGRSVVFENAFATSPWTLPSHASLFTGLYPDSHGVRRKSHALASDAHTLAEVLSERGYATAAIVSAKLMGRKYALDQGFGTYRRVHRSGLTDNTARRVGEAGLEWLRGRPDGPFFLFLHFYDAHSSYSPEPAFQKGLVRPYAGAADGTTDQLRAFRRGELDFDDAGRAHVVDLYDAEIRQLDHRLEELFGALERMGALRNTVVVVTADHGEELFDHGGVLHAVTHYDELLRIPLLLSGPGVPPGVRVRQPASLVDVAPTLLVLLGAAAPEEADGADLSPLWGAAPPAWPVRSLFSQADQHNEQPERMRSVRHGRWKLIVDSVSGESKLFDLSHDAAERRNLAASRPDIVARMEAFLAEAPPPRHAPVELPPIDAAERAQLRELGYLD